MSLPAYYYALYVQICRPDQVPVGSGLCVEGKYIITCAHVVNAAAGSPPTRPHRPATSLLVKFPQNTQLASHCFPAQLLAWGWENTTNASSPSGNGVDELMKNDFAILELDAADSIVQALAQEGKKIQFLKGDLNRATLEALAFDPDQPAVIGYITGSLGIEDRATGTTVVLPDNNPKSFFFEAGSSGSPIWCTIHLEDGSSVAGLAGYADFLNRKDRNSPYDARMFNTANIEQLWSRHLPARKWRVIDIDQRRNLIRKNTLASKVITERGITGKEILCDRSEQLDAIHILKQSAAMGARLFFIYGSERQKLDAFVDRYRYEYLASSGIESQHIFLKMPREKELSLFANKLVGNLCRANYLYQTAPMDTLQCTLPEVLDNLSLSADRGYVLDFKIENEDYSPLQLPLIHWFYQHFLQPVWKGTDDSYDIHLFISYYFNPEEDYRQNLEQLLKIFNSIAIPALENVHRSVVEEWLDIVEGADLERKNRIRRSYPVKEEYDMAEIMEHYKKAIFSIDKF